MGERDEDLWEIPDVRIKVKLFKHFLNWNYEIPSRHSSRKVWSILIRIFELCITLSNISFCLQVMQLLRKLHQNYIKKNGDSKAGAAPNGSKDESKKDDKDTGEKN